MKNKPDILEPTQFDNFDRTMRRLIKVPHSDIQAKLEAEKTAKKRKTKKTSASRALNDREGA